MTEASWNGWTFDRQNMILTWPSPIRYEVALDEFSTNARAMDWLFQVTSKPWADDACLAGLMRAVRDIINPQANLCSAGRDSLYIGAGITTAPSWGMPDG